MNKSLLFSVFSILLLFTSCTSILVNLITKDDINSNLLVYENQFEKKVVFLPMIHIGKEKYYQSVKTIVDSLRNQNFIVLYEGVSKEFSNDTILRKFRKVTGFHFTQYNDSANKSLPKALKNKKYVSQTRENTGIEKDDINADYSLDSLIYHYEKKYSEIKLSECDFTTALNSEYKCKDTVQYNKYHLLHSLRDDNVNKFLQKYIHRDIVIVYGKGHKYMIHADLRDNNYKIIKGKL